VGAALPGAFRSSFRPEASVEVAADGAVAEASAGLVAAAGEGSEDLVAVADSEAAVGARAGREGRDRRMTKQARSRTR
jgi:hypothetical protein